MNRSVTVTTHGGALTLGNWDEVGSRKAAVSWGVAPNVDSITFYPITDGNVIDSVSGLTVSGEGVSAGRSSVSMTTSSMRLPVVRSMLSSGRPRARSRG